MKVRIASIQYQLRHIEDWDGFAPVSYTHLDVYKRQLFGRPHQVRPELAELAREAQVLSQQGEHLFDPGIGQLVKMWGFHADEFKAEIPPAVDIEAWLAARPSIADVSITGETISSRNSRVALDFGGYLKGVALDRAALILRSQGICLLYTSRCVSKTGLTECGSSTGRAHCATTRKR